MRKESILDESTDYETAENFELTTNNIIQNIDNLPLSEQVKIDIQLHNMYIERTPSAKKKYIDFLKEDSIEKQKMVDIFEGKNINPKDIEDAIDVLTRDQDIHRNWATKGGHFGGKEWNNKWISIYDNWKQRLYDIKQTQEEVSNGGSIATELSMRKEAQSIKEDKIKKAWIPDENGKNSGNPFFYYRGKTGETWIYHNTVSENAQKIVQEGFRKGTKISVSGAVNDNMPNPDFIQGYLSNQNPQFGSDSGVVVRVKDAYLVWNNFDDGEQVLIDPKDITEIKSVGSFEEFCNVTKESITLKFKKLSQSTKEDIQKAKAGDQDAIVKIIEENMGLIIDPLIKWGYVPGTPEFEDIISDLKIKIIEDILPGYDISRGAFSTFLTTAVHNFLKNIPRGKTYKAEEKEVSFEEPVKDTKEDVTIQDTLADPNSFLVGLTLSGVRDSFKTWMHETKPELEDILLRIYDLKIDNYTHDQIAEILNEEKLLRKNKVMTKKMVTDYVTLYMKPFLKDYFSSIKIASLNMKKTAQEIDPFNIEPQVSQGSLLLLYTQEAKGLYNEKLEDEIISQFIDTLEKIVEWEKRKIDSKELVYDGQEKDLEKNIMDEKNLIIILQTAKTPQEKMIAIDQVINTVHLYGVYGEYLIIDYNLEFLDELSNLKISSLNMRKKAQKYPKPQVTKQELKRLYKQEAKDLYDEELIDDIISKFIDTLEKLIEWYESYSATHKVDILTGLLKILQSVLTLTLQEKMIAIDQVINTVHLYGVYGEYLIAGTIKGDPFFDELSSLKVSNLNMRKKNFGRQSNGGEGGEIKQL